MSQTATNNSSTIHNNTSQNEGACNALHFLELHEESLARKFNSLDDRVQRHLYKSAQEYTKQRAQLLFEEAQAEVNSSGKNSAITMQIKKLDSGYEDSLASSRPFLNRNPSFLSELHSFVVQNQAQELLEILIKESFQMGIQKQRVQGDDLILDTPKVLEKYSISFASLIFQHLPNIPNLNQLTEKQHLLSPDSTDLCQARFNYGRVTDLTRLLTQAFSEGTQSQLLNEHLVYEKKALEIYRQIGGIHLHKPFKYLASIQEFGEILEGLPSDNIQAVSACFKKNYNLTLPELLDRVFDQKLIKTREYILSGDPLKQSAAKLCLMLNKKFIGKSAFNQQVADFLLSIKHSEVDRFYDLMETILIVDYSKSFNEALKLCSDEVSTALNNLIHNRAYKNTAFKIKKSLPLVEKNPLLFKHLIESLSPHELEELQKDKNTLKEIVQVINDRMPNSCSKNFCLAVFNSDKEKKIAAIVACALEYKSDWIGAPFIDQDEGTRKNIITLYEKHYANGVEGTFFKRLKEICERDDFGILRHIPAFKFFSIFNFCTLKIFCTQCF